MAPMSFEWSPTAEYAFVYATRDNNVASVEYKRASDEHVTETLLGRHTMSATPTSSNSF
jgi:hypothetical protein